MGIHCWPEMDYRCSAKATVTVVLPKSLLELLQSQAERNDDNEALSCIESLKKTNSIELGLE